MKRDRAREAAGQFIALASVVLAQRKRKLMPRTKPSATVTKPDVREMDLAAACVLQLESLLDSERAFLAVCQRLYRNDRGCDTPFECFFRSLVIQTLLLQFDPTNTGRKLPTPDDVAEALEEFREHFNSLKTAAADFKAAYPNVFD